jgi:hypothetical protein
MPVVALAEDFDRPIPQDPEKARLARLGSVEWTRRKLADSYAMAGKKDLAGMISTRNWQAGITLSLPRTHHR